MTGCNMSVDQAQTSVFDVFPGSQMMKAFDVREVPKIVAPGCSSPSELCTIVFYDAGHMVLHNLWVNYPDESELDSYIGPGQFTFNPNSYVWMVFRQLGGRISDTSFPGFFGFNISEYMASNNLEGPTYVNVMAVATDLYALGEDERNRIAQNCPLLLEERFMQENNFAGAEIGWFSPVYNFSAWMPVRMQSTSVSYTICCKSVASPSVDTWLNPIQNPCLDMNDITEEPQIVIEPRMLNPGPSDLAGRSYTLMLAESSASGFGGSTPTGEAPDFFSTPGRVYLHWLRYNVRGDNPADSVTALPFMGIAYRPVEMQNFYFVLLEQPSSQLTSVERWLNRFCVGSPSSGRCQIMLPLFVEAQGLTLAAMNRFKFCNADPKHLYPRYRLVSDGLLSETDACGQFNGGCAP